MTPSLGRNELCWCGSGKKYKRCHLNRDQQARPNPYEGADALRANFAAKTCLHPLAVGKDCQGPIVRAHSVRRSADLLPLSRDGHVYQLQAELDVLMRTGGKPGPKLVGINQASTFNGLCAAHDNATFRPLESREFLGTPEQCFLLFYRAWVRETYTKQAAVKSIELYREADKGKDLPDQIRIQSFVASLAKGYQTGLQDLLFYKAILDAALLNGDHGIIRSCIYWFDRPPDVVCSGATYPYWDFAGRHVQSFGPVPRASPVAVSLLLTPKGGAAVLSWLRDYDATPARFERSLRAEARVGDGLVRLAFSALENTFARPEWWEGLNPGDRESLVKRMAGYMNPFTETPADSLVDDGRVLTSWGPSRITEV